jgi:hypothetical protein
MFATFGDDQQRTGAPQHPFRIAPPDDSGEASSGYYAQASAHGLDGDHHGEGNQGRPEKAIAENGSGHRIGGDAGGIVVGASGD